VEAMKKRQDHREMLDHLSDKLVEDIMSLSDEEIIAEAREEYSDLESEANCVRAIFAKAQAEVGRKRLLAAQEAIRLENGKPQRPKVISLNAFQARRKLEAVLREHGEEAGELTLAARKGKELSDSDVFLMLEDLQELGYYTPEDEPEKE
jgi:hypothetical protein